MQFDWETAEHEVSAHRADTIDRLAGFARHDVLLFWSDENELYAKQLEQWQPILDWIKNQFTLEFQTTNGLETPTQNEALTDLLKTELEHLSNKDLTAIYAAATHMRSVLLALALLKGKISAAEAFELSELEELYQIQKWGMDEEAENRRQMLKHFLLETENFIKS